MSIHTPANGKVYAAISKLQEQDIHSASFKLHLWMLQTVQHLSATRQPYISLKLLSLLMGQHKSHITIRMNSTRVKSPVLVDPDFGPVLEAISLEIPDSKALVAYLSNKIERIWNIHHCRPCNLGQPWETIGQIRQIVHVFVGVNPLKPPINPVQIPYIFSQILSPIKDFHLAL